MKISLKMFTKITIFVALLAIWPNAFANNAMQINYGINEKQWGLDNTGQTIDNTPGKPDADIDMPEAWNNIGVLSKPSVVAVLDSGIDFNHPALQGKIWTNTGEIPGDGLDNDNNGYVDDVNGYNWAGIDQVIYDDASFQIGSNSTYPEIAQSFKGNGGFIKKVWIKLKRNGTDASQGVMVSLRSDLDNEATNCASAGILNISNSMSEREATFSPPCKVVDGQSYYIVISSGQNDINNYDVFGNNNSDNKGDAFANGNISFKKDNGTWAPPIQNNDLYFRLLFENQKGGKPNDEVGHGTHVSGIIAATANDPDGMAGIAGYPQDAVRIMPLRVLDSQKMGSYADYKSAIYYAADKGADIINMSLAGTAYDKDFQNAINYAASKGITIIAAAGNYAEDGNPTVYPAAFNNVIGVGSTTNTDTKSAKSSYNPYVDLSAPGKSIYSTVPTYDHFYSTYSGSDGIFGNLNYDFQGGTSMAAPAVSAVAALIKGKWPFYSPAEIQDIMEANADDLGIPGRDDYFGFGRLNAGNIFAQPVPKMFTLPAPSEINQLKADGKNLGQGEYTGKTSVVIKLTNLTGAPNSAKLGAEIEVKPATTPFNGTGTTKSNLVSYNGTPLNISTTISNLTNSRYHWRARIFDDKKRVSEWTNFNGGNTAFTIDLNKPNDFTIISPKNGDYVKGAVKITANPTDNFGISSTTFYRGNNLIGTASGKLFSAPWSTLSSNNGIAAINAVAKDFAGNTKTAKSVVYIDNTKPKTWTPKKAVIKKGKKGRLYWRVNDWFTGGKARVTIIIKKKGPIKKIRLRKKVKKVQLWKKVKKISLGLSKINRLRFYRYKANLPRGQYKFFVYAKDRAGNNQKNIANNTLVIK